MKIQRLLLLVLGGCLAGIYTLSKTEIAITPEPTTPESIIQLSPEIMNAQMQPELNNPSSATEATQFIPSNEEFINDSTNAQIESLYQEPALLNKTITEDALNNSRLTEEEIPESSALSTSPTSPITQEPSSLKPEANDTQLQATSIAIEKSGSEISNDAQSAAAELQKSGILTQEEADRLITTGKEIKETTDKLEADTENLLKSSESDEIPVSTEKKVLRCVCE